MCTVINIANNRRLRPQGITIDNTTVEQAAQFEEHVWVQYVVSIMYCTVHVQYVCQYVCDCALLHVHIDVSCVDRIHIQYSTCIQECPHPNQARIYLGVDFLLEYRVTPDGRFQPRAEFNSIVNSLRKYASERCPNENDQQVWPHA